MTTSTKQLFFSRVSHATDGDYANFCDWCKNKNVHANTLLELLEIIDVRKNGQIMWKMVDVFRSFETLCNETK
jgi:hypothetical protein